MRCAVLGLTVQAVGLVLLLAAIPLTPLLFLHWLAVGIGFSLLAGARSMRRAAVGAGALYLSALLLGLVLAGASLRGFGVTGASGSASAAGTTLAILSGPLALGAFAALLLAGPPRVLGALAVVVAVAALASFPLGVGDAVLGLGLGAGALLAVASFALTVRRVLALERAEA